MAKIRIVEGLRLETVYIARNEHAYAAIFAGPDAEKRAAEYAYWRGHTSHNSMESMLSGRVPEVQFEESSVAMILSSLRE